MFGRRLAMRSSDLRAGLPARRGAALGAADGGRGFLAARRALVFGDAHVVGSGTGSAPRCPKNRNEGSEKSLHDGLLWLNDWSYRYARHPAHGGPRKVICRVTLSFACRTP